MYVIGTVGRNPLAVFVALRRVCERLGAGACEGVTLLCSPQTAPEAGRIADLLKEKLSFQLPCIHIKPCSLVNPTSITVEIDALAEHHPDLWLDFTGGRKSMGQWAARAIAKKTGKEPILSYVDVEHIDDDKKDAMHAVIDADGRLVDPTVKDERRTLELTLEKLSWLHSYDMDYEIADRQGKPHRVGKGGDANPSPTPSVDEIDIALKMARNLWNVANGRTFAQSLPRKPLWTVLSPWPSLPKADEHWATIPRLLDKLTPENAAEFVNKRKWLEIYSWDCLRSALDDLGRGSTIIEHSCRFKKADSSPKMKDCELDVVAMLGYQFLVVSCGASSDEQDIKRKAFEAIHRARQVGGTASRAIVVSAVSVDRTKIMEGDILDLFGAEPGSVTVWGLGELPKLKAYFRSYLETKMNVKKEAKAWDE